MSLPKGAYQALENALAPDNVCDDPGVTCACSYMWLLYSTHTQSAPILPEGTFLKQCLIHGRSQKTGVRIQKKWFTRLPVEPVCQE